MDQLRQDLLSVKGIGPETADSIILYAAGKPAFVVDAYTRRILERLGVHPGKTYDQVAEWFTVGIPGEVALFNNYHAALVELAKDFCRKDPTCGGCPLHPVCPTGQGRL
jgi:endonuclease-3 related protein